MNNQRFNGRNGNFGQPVRRNGGNYNRPQAPRPAEQTQGGNKDRKFLELVLGEVSAAVDNNTPFDLAAEQKSALKKVLFDIFTDKCKQSFKNGIEVGRKRSGRQENWQGRGQAEPEPEDAQAEYITDPFAGIDPQ
jgi:hypothetical protein